tara:strand:+ start:171 stop:458 length:288 start_codon:yes stop_codon:yes gene_type:complete
MINKKIILGILIIGLLSGCVQSTAFLGPIYTLGSTGNAFQAGLSYGSSKTVTSITGKTPAENIKDILQPKDEDSDLRKLVKKQIKETRKKLNLSK